jgi:hypothetical protein
MHESVLRQPYLKLATVPRHPPIVKADEVKLKRHGRIDGQERKLVVKAQLLFVVSVLRPQSGVYINLCEAARDKVSTSPILERSAPELKPASSR